MKIEEKRNVAAEFLIKSIFSEDLVSQKVIDRFLEHLQIVDIAKSSKIKRSKFKLGKIIFLAEGLIESAFSLNKGKIQVPRIYKPGEVIFECDPDGNATHFHESLRSLTDCKIMSITREDFHDICNEFPELNKIVARITLKELNFMRKRLLENLTLESHERYINFAEEYKEHLSQISNRKIAQYLGITEQGFYKAKSKIKNKRSGAGLDCSTS